MAEQGAWLMDTPEAIQRAEELGILAGQDLAQAVAQLNSEPVRDSAATAQLAERQGQALTAVRELCDDLISRGQGHGAAPTRAELVAAEVAESVLAIIEAGA